MSTVSTVELINSIESAIGFSEAGTTTLRTGYPGQLFEARSIGAEGPGGGAPTVADNATVQLSATVTNRDNTTYDARADALWSSDAPEITSLTGGLLVPGGVADDTAVTVEVLFQSKQASLIITILDTDKDNYVTAPYNFANDGVPDNWQLAYFREGSGFAAPTASPALDGRENYYKYAFVLDPNQYGRDAVVSTGAYLDPGSGESFLTVSYTRPAEVPASISYRVSFGDDPAVTESVESGIAHATIDNGDNTLTETWRDARSIGSARFAVVEVLFTAP